MRSKYPRLALLLVMALCVGGAVAGQTNRPAATLDDLLSEVRGLRVDINQIAIAGVRAELLATRLSLQEQRITTLTKQLAEIRSALRTSVADHHARSSHLARVEEMLQAGQASTPRGELETMVASLQQQVDQAERDEGVLRAQEQQLLQALSSDQSLWLAFNSQLDSIERDLPATRER